MGEGVSADQVKASPPVHDDAERDQGQLVQAQRGHDAVVLKAEKQHFPTFGRCVRRPRGIRDGSGVAPKAGTLAPGAPTEAPSEPPPDPCPIGGCVRRDAIPAASGSGVGVAKGQYRCGDRRRRRDGLGGHRRRRDGGAVRHFHRGTAAPPGPRWDAGAEGGRWRESRCGPPLANLAQAGHRDVTVPVRLETDDVRGQPTNGAAPYAFPWPWQARPSP